MAREELRRAVFASMAPMLRAQIAHAQGIGHVYTRDATGKFSRIESDEQIHRLLTEGTQDDDYWIFAKDPSVQAFQSLMDHAIDKASQHVEHTGQDGQAIVVKWEK